MGPGEKAAPNTARRLAAIILLQPKLDENYRKVKAAVFRVSGQAVDRRRGFFVAFRFSSDAEAETEAARVFKADPRIIKLITVQEILDEQHVQTM